MIVFLQGDSEWSPTSLSTMASTCAAAETSCKTFQQGKWQPDGKCAVTATPSPTSQPIPSPNGGMPNPTGGPTCLIAPGAIGGAHQLASSVGYSANCSGEGLESE